MYKREPVVPLALVMLFENSHYFCHLISHQLISRREGVISYQYSLGGDSPMDSLTGTGVMALYFIVYDKNFKNFNEENIKIIDIVNEIQNQVNGKP